jgi:hypothetical protein
MKKPATQSQLASCVSTVIPFGTEWSEVQILSPRPIPSTLTLRLLNCVSTVVAVTMSYRSNTASMTRSAPGFRLGLVKLESERLDKEDRHLPSRVLSVRAIEQGGRLATRGHLPCVELFDPRGEDVGRRHISE